MFILTLCANTLNMKSLKKIALLLSIPITLGFEVNAQNVNIPDANFKAYLVGSTAINTNADAEIQINEASSFTGLLDCHNMDISDLTGIEAFTALTMLYCHMNTLSSLDVSSNTVLTDLNCSINSLSSIDVSNNTALTYLNCVGNSLSSLDVSNNTALTYLDCQSNSLSGLDVSNNTALTLLLCGNNSLSSLDVSNNTVLTYFSCKNNSLSSLDISNNTALILLNCSYNSLSNLDVTNNVVLTKIRCNCNVLASLNMANGNNTIIGIFDATCNNYLTCIQVDDVAYSSKTWSFIDHEASFSTQCATIGIKNLESIIKLSLYPNPASSVVYIESAIKINIIQILNLTGQKVIDQRQNLEEIDISKLSKGIYTVRIFTDLGDVVKKLIKE